MSSKLAIRLREIASGELGRVITQLIEDWMKGYGHSNGAGSSVPGLVLCRLILKACATGPQSEAVDNLNDLQMVQIKNGNEECESPRMTIPATSYFTKQSRITKVLRRISLITSGCRKTAAVIEVSNSLTNLYTVAYVLLGRKGSGKRCRIPRGTRSG